MNLAKELHNKFWIRYVLGIPLLIASGFWLALHSVTTLLFLVIILLVGVSWIISHLNLQVVLLQMLVVFLPFSVELSVSDGLNMNIPSEPMLALIVFSMAWDILRKPGTINRVFSFESRWAIPFLLSFLISTLFSTIPWVSVKFSMVNITYILVFFVWQHHLLRQRPGLFLRLIVLYTGSFLAVSLLSVFHFCNFGWNPVTIRGIFQPFYKDNTIFGATSALLASFWIAYAFKARSLTAKLICGFSGFVFWGGVVLSTSRAAALSIMFFILVLLLLRFRVRLRYVCFSFVLLWLGIAVYRNPVYDILKEDKHLSHRSQFGYMEQLESSGNISSDISNIERLNRWSAGLAMFAERPAFGFGPGTYQFVYIPFQKPEFQNQLTVKDPWHIPENSGGTAHSEYFLVMSEMGLFGLLALLVLLGRWTWIAFVRARHHPNRGYIAIGFAVLSSYLLHAFFNNFLSTDKFAFLFWGTAAWMVSEFNWKADEEYTL